MPFSFGCSDGSLDKASYFFLGKRYRVSSPNSSLVPGVEDPSTISGGGITSNAWATQQWTFARGYLLQRKSTYNTLPPIIIGSVENGFPLNIRFLSFRMIFHLHEYGRKGNWMRFSQWCVVCWLKALILFQGLPPTFFSFFFWKCGSHKTGWLNLSSCCSSKHLPWYLQRCW